MTNMIDQCDDESVLVTPTIVTLPSSCVYPSVSAVLQVNSQSLSSSRTFSDNQEIEQSWTIVRCHNHQRGSDLDISSDLV